MMFSFSPERQELFARLSGDYNPIHTDPVACRRLIHGQPVVHGVHALLWAFNVWLEAEANRIRITRLSVKFRSPCFVGKVPQVAVTSQGDLAAKLAVTVDGAKMLVATVEWQRATTADLDLPASSAEGVVCRSPSLSEMRKLSGEIPLVFDRPLAKALFPNVERCLAAEQVAVLLATSRLVGMEVPGRNSIFGGMELEAIENSQQPLLTYRVEDYDERLSLVTIRVDGPGLSGLVSALLRPEARHQSTVADLRKLVPADLFRGERALVIGGSRGLGEVAAKVFALGGAEVRLTYHQGATDAEKCRLRNRRERRSRGVLRLRRAQQRGRLGVATSRLGTDNPLLFCDTVHRTGLEGPIFEREICQILRILRPWFPRCLSSGSECQVAIDPLSFVVAAGRQSVHFCGVHRG